MFKIFTKFLLITALLIGANNLFAQQKGSFTKYLTCSDGQREVLFQVPSNYTPTKEYPLVVALHPYQTPPSSMIQMLGGAADSRHFILASPQNHPNYSGEVIDVIIDWVTEEYNLEPKNIVVTGYSAGGGTTLEYGFSNSAKLKGVIPIGMGRQLSSADLSVAPRLPMGVIIGTADQNYSGVISMTTAYKNAGGLLKLIKKNGLGHYGDYYFGYEIEVDWLECYDFIQEQVFAPGITVLTSPESGSNIEPGYIDLVWDENPDAEEYEIQIYKNDDRIVSKKVNANEYTLKATELKAEYMWKVRSVNGGGDGPWSQEFTFKIMPPAPDQVTLSEPADNAVDLELTTVFKWDAVDEAEEYELEFTNRETFVKQSVTTEETEASSDKLAVNTEYTWKVRAIAQEVAGEWSDDRTFTTKDIILAEAVLSQPQADAINLVLDFEFKWEPVEGADKYNLILTKISDDSELTIETTETLVSLEDDLENGEEYSWKIVPFAGTKEGPASEVRFFHTILETSSSFFPADGATNIDRNFTVMWNPVNNAESYHLTVTEKESEIVFIDKNDIPQEDASYIEYKIKDLEAEMTYTWKVRAVNSDGESQWTDEMTFTTSTNISVQDVPSAATNISAAPNPFSNATAISFNMIESGNITIDIYDINGNIIDNVFSGFAEKGSNSYIWNAGSIVSSVYYYNIKINNKTIVGKLILAK